MDMDIDDDYKKGTVIVINEMSQNNDSTARYYEKKDLINLVMTNEDKFMSPFYWKRVHELITSSITKIDSRHGIYQVKDNNELCKYVENNKTYIKESRFSYIRPIHGSTRLIVYNSSNVTCMEGMVHRGAKVIVEVPEGCMIVFSNDTFHAGVKSYAKYGGNYLSHLRLFAYIVEESFFSVDESIEKT